jgi:ParB-like nuclease domain
MPKPKPAIAPTTPESGLIPLRDIVTDAGTQFRVTYCQEAIERYTEIYKADINGLPPISVCHDETAGQYYVVDGFHRVLAFRKTPYPMIPCHIVKGDLRDAKRLALAANATHGVSRSDADIRNAILSALGDPEWAALNHSAVGRMVGCSDQSVRRMRKLLGADAKPWAIAHRLQLDVELVTTAINLLSEEFTYKRGDKVVSRKASTEKNNSDNAIQKANIADMRIYIGDAYEGLEPEQLVRLVGITSEGVATIQKGAGHYGVNIEIPESYLSPLAFQLGGRMVSTNGELAGTLKAIEVVGGEIYDVKLDIETELGMTTGSMAFWTPCKTAPAEPIKEDAGRDWLRPFIDALMGEGVGIYTAATRKTNKNIGFVWDHRDGAALPEDAAGMASCEVLAVDRGWKDIQPLIARFSHCLLVDTALVFVGGWQLEAIKQAAQSIDNCCAVMVIQKGETNG